MAILQTNKVSVTAPSSVVVFGQAMTSTDFTLTFRCYDPVTLATIPCDVNPANNTVNGFTAEPAVSGTLEYIAAEYGAPVGLITPTGRLSRDWTAQKFWAEAIRDLRLAGVQLDQFERFNLINRAVSGVASVFFPLLSNQYLTEQSVSQSGDKISLASLRTAMGGAEQKFRLESSLATTVLPVSKEEHGTFRTGSHQNKNTICWTLIGDYLYLKKGTSLASYGTLTFYYARNPIPVSLNDSLIDFADGAPMEVAIFRLKRLLAERYGVKLGNEQEAADLVKAMYSNLGVQANLEDINDKVKRVL